MTEPADPGVHAASEVVALDPSARHASAVRAAFPHGVTCRRYICLSGCCGSAPADGQDPTGISGQRAGPYSADAAGTHVEAPLTARVPFSYGHSRGLHISLAQMPGAAGRTWPTCPAAINGPAGASGSARRKGQRWRRTATTL